MRFRKTLFFILFILFLCGSVFSYLVLQKNFVSIIQDSHSHRVIISKKSSLCQIAQKLKEEQIINSEFFFIWNARLRRLNASIQAGEYEFSSPRSLKSVLTKLVHGKTFVRKFTVVEGKTSQEIVNALKLLTGLTGEIKTIPAEGCLLPDTYHFSYGDSRQNLLQRMVQAQNQYLLKTWKKRNLFILLSSAQEAVILASIIEKETCLKTEKTRVAALFYNRLRLSMRLQSDPTVLYGLHKEKSMPLNTILSRADLKYDTPYNTYTRSGLPPTPICNPSTSSIEAVLHPIQTNELYFVANGFGGHNFSSHYKDHKIHHQAWRRHQMKKISSDKK